MNERSLSLISPPMIQPETAVVQDQPISHPGAFVESAVTEEPEVAADDEWAPVSTKLSKKDKKKAKKGISLADLEDETEGGKGIETPVPAEDETLRELSEAVPEPTKDKQTSKHVETGAVRSASIEEQHDAEPHQAFLADAEAKANDFPSQPGAEAPREHSDGSMDVLQNVSSAEHPTIVDLAQVQSTSAQEHHDTKTHQDFLADAEARSSTFPSIPAKSSTTELANVQEIPADVGIREPWTRAN